MKFLAFLVMVFIVLFYLFGYRTIVATESIRSICNNIVVGQNISELNLKEISNKLNVSYPQSGNSIESKSKYLVISGGWMSSCHVKYYENVIQSVNYLDD